MVNIKAPKLITNRAVFRSVASCRNPVAIGPTTLPMEKLVVVMETARATPRGFRPGKLNGTALTIGQQPHATPFTKAKSINTGSELAKLRPIYVPAIKRPSA